MTKAASKHGRKNIILDPFPTVVDPSDPNQLALNPKVSYCVVIYSKHSRKNIILDPFPTVVDPSDPNELALNPKVSYCVVIYSKHSRKNIILDPFPTVVDPSDPNELGADKHFAPLWHIILILSQPVFALSS